MQGSTGLGVGGLGDQLGVSGEGSLRPTTERHGVTCLPDSGKEQVRVRSLDLLESG